MLSIFTSTMFFFQSTSNDRLKPVMTTGLVNMHNDRSVECQPCMYLGVSVYNFKKCIILSEDLLYLYKQSTDPDEIQHFIWVSTVCQSTIFCFPNTFRDNIYKNTKLKIKHFIKKD